MKLYQLEIEGSIFFDGGSRQRLGFFTTVYVRAGGSARAVELASRMLSTKLEDRGLSLFRQLGVKPHYIIREIFEVEEETQQGLGFRGFTFFEVGLVEYLRIACRLLWLRTREPWRLVML